MFKFKSILLQTSLPESLVMQASEVVVPQLEPEPELKPVLVPKKSEEKIKSENVLEVVPPPPEPVKEEKTEETQTCSCCYCCRRRQSRRYRRLNVVFFV